MAEDEMSASEMAALFGEPTPKPQPAVKTPKTEEEFKEYERKLNESNDIYKIAARIKNAARFDNGNLTPHGEMLCNTFVHVVKAFYDFSETMKDPVEKAALIKLTRAQEIAPAHLISALIAGVTILTKSNKRKRKKK